MTSTLVVAQATFLRIAVAVNDEEDTRETTV